MVHPHPPSPRIVKEPVAARRRYPLFSSPGFLTQETRGAAIGRGLGSGKRSLLLQLQPILQLFLLTCPPADRNGCRDSALFGQLSKSILKLFSQIQRKGIL